MMSGDANVLFCFFVSFPLSKKFICVGVGTYIWVSKNVTTAKGLSEIGKTELKGQAPQ